MTRETKWFLADQVRQGPWGGGNAFLRGFASALKKRNQLAETWLEADFVLTNSFPFEGYKSRLSLLRRIKRRNPHIKIVHRIDGPISTSRGYPRHEFFDRAVFEMNQTIADLTIFQSNWSLEQSIAMGYTPSSELCVISNGVDKEIFRPGVRSLERSKKIELITSSWSGNVNKGMRIYSAMDNKLDFGRYRYRFFGPDQGFSGIENMGSVAPHELAAHLRESDYFITASKNDSCSNSLLEAMACGLTPLALDHGGHPEIVKNRDFLFRSEDELLSLLEAGVRMKSPEDTVMSLDEVGAKYNNAAVEASARKTASASLFAFGGNSFPAKPDLKKVALELDSRFGSSLAPRVEHALRSNSYCDVSRSYWNSSVSEFSDMEFSELQASLREFMDSMNHKTMPGLFRFTWSGDTSAEPLLISSVFAIKLHKLLGLQPAPELAAHVKSFRSAEGLFFEDYLLRPQPLADSLELVVNRKLPRVQRSDSIRAQNRQAVSALLEFDKSEVAWDPVLESSSDELIRHVREMNWSNPWHAASHVSHIVFFLMNSGTPLRESDAFEVLSETHKQFSPETAVSSDSMNARLKVNGLMKLVTAYQWLPVKISESTAKLVVDMCLNIVENRHACDQFNLLLVLRYFSEKVPDHKAERVRSFAKSHKSGLAGHFWPQFGGFSFYAEKSQFSVYGKKVSRGYPEPDLHGTVMLTWALSELEAIENSPNERRFGNLRP